MESRADTVGRQPKSHAIIPIDHLKCNAHSMFPLFPENRKSIPKFPRGKTFLKNVTL